MARRTSTAGHDMLAAVQKVDFQPVMNEVHKHPFLWVSFSIVLFFTIGNLFEIMWMLLRDLRRFVWRIIRYPRNFVKHKIVDRIWKKRLRKKYGQNAREKDRRFFKKK